MANGLDTEITGEMLAALPDPLFGLTESGRYAAVAGGQDERLYHDGSNLIGCYLQDVMPASAAAWFQTRRSIGPSARAATGSSSIVPLRRPGGKEPGARRS